MELTVFVIIGAIIFVKLIQSSYSYPKKRRYCASYDGTLGFDDDLAMFEDSDGGWFDFDGDCGGDD